MVCQTALINVRWIPTKQRPDIVVVRLMMQTQMGTRHPTATTDAQPMQTDYLQASMLLSVKEL
jgi:hypothetical protein